MGNDLDVRFTMKGIELTGPVDEKVHQMMLKGFRIREVGPGVLNVQANFDAQDNEAGATLLRRFLGFLGSTPGTQQPEGEAGTLDDRNDLDTLSGGGG